MKKKVLISSYNLDIGGIETSLVNMLKNMDYEEYDVTLLLEKKEGIFLDKIPDSIKVLEYHTFDDKNVLLRKVKNRLKLIYYTLKFKNKFDFAGLYAPYLGPEATVIRHASVNNAIWTHSNYNHAYKEDESKIKEFFDKRKISKFKKIFFVSNESKDDFLKVYPSLLENSIVLSNIIDYKSVLEKSEYKVSDGYKSPLIVFVGRLDEDSKRISLLLKTLSKFDCTYNLLIIGDGPDREMYETIVKELNIHDKVHFLGKKENPFPYIKMSDLVVLPSRYEGFPVVLMEAIILNKIFISSVGVSDKYVNLSDYGYVISQDENDLYLELKKFFNNELTLKASLDLEEYTKNIIEDLNDIFGGKNDKI